MSIANVIQNIQTHLSNAYDTIENKGVDLTNVDKNIENLSTEINLIQSGGGGGRDWSAIGYSGEPDAIAAGYNYAKNIYDNWVNTTNYSTKFDSDADLVFMPLVNTSNGTDFSYMFRYCQRLMYIPLLNTSNGTNFTYMFSNNPSLKTIPSLNTSNGTNFSYMFADCSNITTIPSLNTSNGTNFSSMFSGCSNITTIPSLNTSKGKSVGSMFSSCLKLTNLGGLANVGQAYLTTKAANYSHYTIGLSNSPQLTYDSLMNVINNLYDIATKGCKAQNLVLGSTNLGKLSAEEIAIATTKGWTVS